MANYQTLSPGELAKLPSSILDTLPALQPPAGVESNFANPEDRASTLNAVMTVLFCFMFCFFANRVYTKLFIIRKVGWDDLSCTIGFLCSMGYYIIIVLASVLGPVGKHQWDVKLVTYLSGNFNIITAIIVFLSPLTLLFIKLTFFLLYFQVFRPLRWLRISVYIGVTLTCAFYGAASITQVIFSTPRRGQTWFEHDFSRGEAGKASILSVPLAAVGLGIDLVLLVMPIAAVVGLQLPTKRKIGIVFIFMFGIFACVGSLLSIYYRVISNRSSDTSWNEMPVVLVTFVEMSIGTSCACMPAFSKMLHHHLPALEKFRSMLSIHVGLRSSKSGDTSAHHTFSQSDGPSHYPMAKSVSVPYGQLRIEASPHRGAAYQPTYELGQLQSVQTYIGKGWKKGASDDKIHLTHEIQQQQASTR